MQEFKSELQQIKKADSPGKKCIQIRQRKLCERAFPPKITRIVCYVIKKKKPKGISRLNLITINRRTRRVLHTQFVRENLFFAFLLNHSTRCKGRPRRVCCSYTRSWSRCSQLASRHTTCFSLCCWVFRHSRAIYICEVRGYISTESHPWEARTFRSRVKVNFSLELFFLWFKSNPVGISHRLSEQHRESVAECAQWNCDIFRVVGECW